MKLRTRMLDEKTGRISPATGLRTSFLAFALISTGCVFNPNGLPALPDAQGKDGRHDSSIAESSPDAARKDLSHAESPPRLDLRADMRGDLPKHDSTHKDKAVPDTAKWDLKTDNSKADTTSGCPLSSTGTFSGYITYGTPKTIGGYSFDYLGKSGTDAVLDISCGGKAIVSSQKCQVGLNTTINVTVDGKKITIVPVSANATVLNASITVEAI